MSNLKKKIELEQLKKERTTKTLSTPTIEKTISSSAIELKPEFSLTKTNQEQKELLTECSNILMQDQLEPDNLAIQSMKQLNYVLQSLTNHRKERIVNNETVVREELPFAMAGDCKKLAEAIGIMMKGLNESRKIRTTTYLKLKEMNKKE